MSIATLGVVAVSSRFDMPAKSETAQPAPAPAPQAAPSNGRQAIGLNDAYSAKTNNEFKNKLANLQAAAKPAGSPSSGTAEIRNRLSQLKNQLHSA